MKTNKNYNKGKTTMISEHVNAKNTFWTGFAASIPGGGHIRRGIPCQDASAVMTSPRPAVIVCDGRGSAKLSHFGAQGAVEAFRFQMSILEPFLVSILDDEEEKQMQWGKFCQIMYRTLMQVKYDLAEKYNEEEKEFDCTVAFAIAGKKNIGCFQVGDGSIVLRQNGICKTVFIPEKGEYANQTHFLRPGGEEEMKFQHTLLDAGVNSGIAVTSDGPEHLMFRLADMTPGKIFDLFLDDLRKEELCKQDLMDYLTRREWTEDPRGSDDRSLALLARIGDESVMMPNSEVNAEIKTEPQVSAEVEDVQKVPAEVEDAQKVPAEVEDAQKVPAEVEDAQAVPAKVEDVQAVPAKTEETKKKIPYKTLTIVSSLVIGLLAETACLLKQHQTITYQRQEIHCLNQLIEQKKEIRKKTNLPQRQTPAMVTKEEAPKANLPRPDRIDKGSSNVPEAKKAITPSPVEKAENRNIHKEDTHNEER